MSAMNMKQTIRCLEDFPTEISLLLSANHGVGKSQCIIQFAKAHNIPCIDFRLSQVEAADLIGMPFHINGRTVYAPPDWYPLMEEDATRLQQLLGLTDEISRGYMGDRGILFLDELNRATRDVQQAVFELIHDHKMHGLRLPPGWRVVSAINGDQDIYSTTKMEPALLSRFFVIDFTPSLEEWLKWADTLDENGQLNIHPVISQFIRKNDMFLDPTKEQIEEASLAGIQKVHDRRAWHKFSQVIWSMVNAHKEGTRHPLAKDPDSVNWMFQLAGGFVGPVAQAKFKSFLETDYQALDADVILNKMTTDIEKKLQDIVDAGRIPELASYNELILDHLQKHCKKGLNNSQSVNLAIYVRVLPMELRSDLWKKWNKEDKDISTAWYREKSLGGKPNSELVLKALVNPSAGKKEPATK